MRADAGMAAIGDHVVDATPGYFAEKQPGTLASRITAT